MPFVADEIDEVEFDDAEADPMLSLLEEFTNEAVAQNLLGLSGEQVDFVVKDIKEVVANIGGPGTQPTTLVTNKALYFLLPFEPLKKVSGQVLFSLSVGVLLLLLLFISFLLGRRRQHEGG